MKIPLLCTVVLATTLAPPAFAKGLPTVGKPAPVFKLRDLTGGMVRLDEIAYQGREKSWAKKQPLLLDFFRTDCSPCRTAMPDLVAFYNTHKADGVEVVLVALLETDNGRQKLESYLAGQTIPFRIVVDTTEHFAKKYLGSSVKLPATFLIDRDGVLVKAKYGAKGTLEEHFGPALPKVLKAGPNKGR